MIFIRKGGIVRIVWWLLLWWSFFTLEGGNEVVHMYMYQHIPLAHTLVHFEYKYCNIIFEFILKLVNFLFIGTSHQCPSEKKMICYHITLSSCAGIYFYALSIYFLELLLVGCVSLLLTGGLVRLALDPARRGGVFEF